MNHPCSCHRTHHVIMSFIFDGWEKNRETQKTEEKNYTENGADNNRCFCLKIFSLNESNYFSWMRTNYKYASTFLRFLQCLLFFSVISIRVHSFFLFSFPFFLSISFDSWWNFSCVCVRVFLSPYQLPLAFPNSLETDRNSESKRMKE